VDTWMASASAGNIFGISPAHSLALPVSPGNLGQNIVLEEFSVAG